MSEDLSHDPHLRAALRHAPDHALAPPAGVSQTILNAARHVHKPARPAATTEPAVRITVAPPRAIAWLHQWFASPRLAGGLATGLVAALGLGLWIDLRREPVFERTPTEAAKEQRSSEPAPAEQAATRQRGDDPNRVARVTRNVETTKQEAGDETPSDRRSGVAPKTERRADSAPRPRQAAPPTPERREGGAVAPEHERALAKAAPAEPAMRDIAPAAPTAPAPSAAEATPAQKAAAAAVEAQRDAASRSDSRMSLAAGRAATMAGARAAAAEPVVDATAASPAFTLLRRARIDTASGSARWTWMPPGKAGVTPMDDAAHDWLARVVQASRGRRTDSAERAGPGDALEVRWWRDDWPQATLRIEADGLRWIEHNGPIRHAPLDAATLQRLNRF